LAFPNGIGDLIAIRAPNRRRWPKAVLNREEVRRFFGAVRGHKPELRVGHLIIVGGDKQHTLLIGGARK
jgi:hypothetical protein